MNNEVCAGVLSLRGDIRPRRLVGAGLRGGTGTGWFNRYLSSDRKGRPRVVRSRELGIHDGQNAIFQVCFDVRELGIRRKGQSPGILALLLLSNDGPIIGSPLRRND